MNIKYFQQRFLLSMTTFFLLFVAISGDMSAIAGSIEDVDITYEKDNDRIRIRVRESCSLEFCSGSGFRLRYYPKIVIHYRYSADHPWQELATHIRSTKTQSSYKERDADFYIENPVKGHNFYEIRIVPYSQCSNAILAGGGHHFFNVEDKTPDTWVFMNFNMERKGDKNILTWRDPVDRKELDEAVDNWYYTVQRRKRSAGDGTWPATWSTIEAKLGGKNAFGLEKYEDNLGTEACYEYQYRLLLIYEANGYKFSTRKTETKSFTIQRKTPMPSVFRVANADSCDAKERLLNWDLKVADMQECTDLWFVIKRGEVNNKGELIAGTEVILTGRKDGTTYGGELIGGGSSLITAAQRVGTISFSYTDNYNLENNKRYRYTLSARSRIDANGNLGSIEAKDANEKPLTRVKGPLKDGVTTVSASVDNSLKTVTITWADIWDNEDKFILYKKWKGASGEGQKLGETEENVTSFTYQEGVICQDFEYTVKVRNSCNPEKLVGTVGGDGIPIFVSGDLSDTYPGRSLEAYKGYQSDFVQLNWTVAYNAGSLNRQNIYRRALGDSAEPELIATVGAGIRQFRDMDVEANVLHEYFVEGEGMCGSSALFTNRISDVGYRAPFGMVTGHIEYEGGVSVQDCKVTAVNASGIHSNRSLFFDGDKDFVFFIDNKKETSAHEYLAYGHQSDLEFLQGRHDRTIEFWFNASSFNGGYLFRNGSQSRNIQGAYLALILPTEGNRNWQLLLGGDQRVDFSLDVAPGEWHHFAVTMEANGDMSEIKIYIDGKSIDINGNEMIWNRFVDSGSELSGYHFLLGSDQIVDAAINPLSYHGYMDEFRIWETARSSGQIRQTMNSFLQGSETGLAMYLRMDEGVGNFLYDASFKRGQGYRGNHGVMYRGRCCNNLTYSTNTPSSDQLGNNAITDEDGNYSISYIRYENNGELFKVTPFIPHHKFQPNNRSVFVGTNAPVHNNQDFKDISSFLVTGTVYYGNSEEERFCPAEGIFLTVDGNIVVRDGQPVQTDANGEFAINVPIGEHYISVQQTLHSFAAGRFPAQGTHDFQQPVSGLSFVDNTKMVVIGKVVGGKAEGDQITGLKRSKNNIGQATLIFESTKGCYSDTVTTDEYGEYRVEVFPLEYTLYGGASVTNKEIFIASNPLIRFESQRVDLSQVSPVLKVSDTVWVSETAVRVDTVSYHMTKDFVYRSPHTMVVSDQNDVEIKEGVNYHIGESYILVSEKGVADTVYTNQLAHSVFLKSGTYDLRLKLTEIYENRDQGLNAIIYDTVGVTDAEITVNNGLSGDTDMFRIDKEAGDTIYSFQVGDPNLTTNALTPELDYLKKLEIVSTKGQESNKWELYGYVFGASADGTKFTTQGPEMPQHILRDPPGSNSFASILKGSEFTSSFNWNLDGVAETELKTGISVGSNFSAGLGVSIKTDIEGQTYKTITGSATLGGGNDYSETVSIEEEISTSDDPSMVGADADIFIGNSRNLDFGVADVLELVPDEMCGGSVACKVTDEVVSVTGKTYSIGRRKGFMVDPQGYATYFVYTAKHIRDKLIPDLMTLRNYMLESSSDYKLVFLDKDDERFGTNNDDKIAWGNAASEVDSTGPSYLFTKIFKPDEPKLDSVRWYNQQIRLWKEALALNEKMKVNAVEGQSVDDAGDLGNSVGNEFGYSAQLLNQKVDDLEKNVSFSSGTSYSRTVSLSNEIAWNFSYEIAVSGTVGAELTGKVNNTGASVEKYVKIGVTQSGSTVRGVARSIEYGFTLRDDDDGDFYSVDILDGGNQNGPVFRVRGAETSCPYEDALYTEYYKPGTQIQPATVRREKPGIAISPVRQVGIPSDQEAVFTLTLSNSNTDDAMTYVLSVDDLSNPYGAILNIDGQDPNRPFTIPAGGSINKTLVVRKSPHTNDFMNLKLEFGSACDEISEEATFSVSFVPTCAKSTLLSPTKQWVLNTAFNDTLPVIMSDYDLNFAGFEKAVFQYKPSTSANWINVYEFYNKDEAGADTLLLSRFNTYTPFDWNVRNLRDGNYDLRIKTVCANGVERVSDTYSGKMDRLNPVNFGQPTPLNGVLTANDELSLRFNEIINEGLINKNLDIDVRGVLNGTAIAHFTSLHFAGNQVMTIPPVNLNGRSFTLEFFAKKTEGGTQVIAAQEDLWQIGFDENGHVYFEAGGNRVITADPVNTTAWNHYAVVYEHIGRQVYIYVNTEAKVSGVMAIPVAEGMKELHIGQGLVGNMHELRLWGDVRSVSEIRSNYLVTQRANAAGLLGYWPMDEGKGTVASDMTGRRQAIVPNTWSFAQEARALRFDGVDDYFGIEAAALNADQETDFTLSFWFKPENIANTTLISNGNINENSAAYQPTAWAVYADVQGTLFVKNNGYTLRVNNQSFANEWHHFALVVNRQGSVNVYLNGHVTASVSSSPFSAFAGAHVYVGAYGRIEAGVETVSNFFKGSVDELRFWNAAREQKQIVRDAYHRLKGDEPGLLAYYPFEKYANAGLGQLALTETKEDLADKSAIGLYPFPAELKGAVFTSETAPVKIERPVEAVTFTYVVNNDAIIITPTTAPERIEKTILDITVRNIQDLNGNKMSSAVTWTAFVNKNQVVWSEAGHTASIEKGEEYVFSTSIDNLGGKQESYSILNLPAWLEASRVSGSINPKGTHSVQFRVKEGLNIGMYEENIVLSTQFGTSEVYALSINVTGETPDWHINPGDFEYSMGVVGQLKINDVFSTDENDMLAAFVDGELRGVASVRRLSGSGSYRVYLNIHSNKAESEKVTFRIWDASRGVILEDITPEMVFVNNALEGTQANPVVFEGGAVHLSAIMLKPGWNWISINVEPTDTDVDAVLSGLHASNGDLIKGSGQYDQYLNTVGWVGSLSSTGGINFKESYKIRVTRESILPVKGRAVDLRTSPIAVHTGWNWIAYLGSNILQVNEALASYQATEGDVVKGQKHFAVYDPSEGWVGSLTTFVPGHGYMLSAQNTGSVVYPGLSSFSSGRNRAVRTFDLPESVYESTMNIIAELEHVSTDFGADYWLIVKDKDGNILGGVEDRDAVYYLTTEGNVALGTLSFYLKHKVSGEELPLEESLSFVPDALIGYPRSYKLHLREGVMAQPLMNSVSVYPNPVGENPELMIRYTCADEGELSIDIYSVLGIPVAQVYQGAVSAGNHVFTCNTEKFVAGVYMLVVTRDGEKETIKFTK